MRPIREEVILDVVLESIAVARQVRLPHMLIGALALVYWGQPRATTDVDLMIHVRPDAWGRFKHRAQQAGFVIDELWERYNPMLREQQMRFHKHRITVDFLTPRDEHDQEALRRRRWKSFAHHRIAVVAPDDLILQKLKTGRPRDLEDAASILERSQKMIDHHYLRAWAKRLRVVHELDYLLSLGERR